MGLPDLAEAKKYAEAVDAGPDEDDRLCRMCGQGYSLRDGEDPTPLCDHCAHDAVQWLPVLLSLIRT